MTRWITVGLLAAAALTALPTHAQPAIVEVPIGVRQFPPKAERGVMIMQVPPEVLVNGQVMRLSPGARIKGPGNLLVTSGSVMNQQLPVMFTRDPYGNVLELWILSEAEASAIKPATPSLGTVLFGTDSMSNTPRDDGKTPFHMLPKFPAQ
ncbi:MAG TPA: hypothetical protein PKD73_07045 [Burkholderiaceae bacterium]|jgi:hypothetical protein|nr:hypothetical protein [Burkholderiaceae bacterium]